VLAIEPKSAISTPGSKMLLGTSEAGISAMVLEKELNQVPSYLSITGLNQPELLYFYFSPINLPLNHL
jgi:hypothetical protein